MTDSINKPSRATRTSIGRQPASQRLFCAKDDQHRNWRRAPVTATRAGAKTPPPPGRGAKPCGFVVVAGRNNNVTKAVEDDVVVVEDRKL